MHGLGDLESAVMDVLWQAEDAIRVREVMERLDTGRPLAYTTVLTVLDHLHRKSWVRRELVGKAYRYVTALSREEAGARALREVIDSSGAPEAVLLHFAQSVSEHESNVLRKALGDRPDRP